MSDDEPTTRFGFNELERAILDTTVTLCQQLSHHYSNAHAREYVAAYLDSIAENLRALPDTVPSRPPDTPSDAKEHEND